MAVAVDGLDTLAKVAEFQPDLVLLDIMMPKMSGFEVCKTLKRDEKTRQIMILMVTALNNDALIANASFNSGTHVLTVAGAADGIGDHRVFGYFIPPNADLTKLIGVPGFTATQASPVPLVNTLEMSSPCSNNASRTAKATRSPSAEP